jgi:hypothetical protein
MKAHFPLFGFRKIERIRSNDMPNVPLAWFAGSLRQALNAHLGLKRCLYSFHRHFQDLILLRSVITIRAVSRNIRFLFGGTQHFRGRCHLFPFEFDFALWPIHRRGCR